ncbi:riboflavin biosynthesis protein RibF [bacterium]|nr:riboflavin biosynthesis protein RibF [bacterium]
MVKVFGRIERGLRVGIGVFDGLHIGHAQIMDRTDVLLTLYPHPDLVLSKNRDLKYLSTLTELRAMTRRLWAVRFTKDLSQLTAHEFLEMLYAQTGPSKIVVGSDFRFGRAQGGNIDLLQTWGKKCRVDVEIVPLQESNGKAIKSSAIRHALREGNLAQVVDWLGHPYPVFGYITPGYQRGSEIGFPTANLQVSRHKLLPPNGVFAAQVRLDGEIRPAVAYLGNRPTFNAGYSIEVHIPGFSGNLYGRRIEMWLTSFIRAEQKFESIDALREQIGRDLAVALEARPISLQMPK